MIIRLHHAQITISTRDEAPARFFYCEVLGLQEITKPESLKDRGGFWLQLGDIQMHIGIEEGVERNATKAHLAYQVTDLALWRAHLEQHGVNILESIPIPGYARFECRDPFGNRIEMIQQLNV